MQLEEPLRQLWFPTPDRATAYETGFVVVGPIPNDNPGHLTTGLDTDASPFYPNPDHPNVCVQIWILSI